VTVLPQQQGQVAGQELVFSADPDDLREGFDSPLIDFQGLLNSVELRAIQGSNARGTYVSYFIDFNFSQVEVYESAIPWGQPAATVSVRSNPRGTAFKLSEWGKFTESAGNYFSKDELANVLSWSGKGLVIRFKKWAEDLGEDRQAAVDPATNLRPRRMVNCWHIVGVQGRQAAAGAASVNGAGPVGNINDRLLALIDGKTLSEFGSQALVLPEVKTNPQIAAELMDQSWIAKQQAAGKLSVDEAGVYHVVGG
jgi:hypothetical protein